MLQYLNTNSDSQNILQHDIINDKPYVVLITRLYEKQWFVFELKMWQVNESTKYHRKEATSLLNIEFTDTEA